jgi:hypothetical protein
VFTIRRSLIATAATVALAGFAALGVAAPASAATLNGASKIGICKANSSGKFSFVYRTAADLAAGQFADADIVPAFDYTTASGLPASFLGHNTSSTELTADCVAVQASTDFVVFN